MPESAFRLLRAGVLTPETGACNKAEALRESDLTGTMPPLPVIAPQD